MQPNIGNVDLSIVVSMTSGGIIGRDGMTPWQLPSYRAWIKDMTRENGIIVTGRKNFEAIRAEKEGLLPGRHYIVLSTNRSLPHSGSIEIVASLEAAIAAIAAHGGSAFVIGGQQMYLQFLPLASTIHATIVHTLAEGNILFPAVESAWQDVDESPVYRWHEHDDYRTSTHKFQRMN